MRYIIILLLTLFCLPAFATYNPPPPDPGMTQEQGQVQGQDQLQDQSQQQTVTTQVDAASAGGNAEVTINETHPDNIKIKNVPNVYAPPSYPTAPCRVAWSAGVGVVGFGGSGGGSVLDEECDLRETARSWANLGYETIAAKILCTAKASQNVNIQYCKELGIDTYDGPPVEPTRDYSQFNQSDTAQMFTTEEADERCRRQGKACDFNK